MKIYSNFLIEFTQESNTHVRTSSLYDAFKKCFVNNNPNTHIPSNREFTISIKKYKTVKRSKKEKLSRTE